MTNHPIDEAAERREFERIIGAPPYEHMCDTNGRSSAWLGQYKRYETQLAWELWLVRARIAAQREAELRRMLSTAIDRIEDMLNGDDGQAWKEAERVLPRLRATIAQEKGT